MFHNFSHKLLALALAVLFWAFVVSLKSAIFEFPQAIPVQIFNVGEKLAVAEAPENVHLTVRAESTDVFRTLQPSDFDAYVDAGDLGAGSRKVPVTVASKNPKVEILRAEPKDIFLVIEPIREKIMPVQVFVEGNPASGFVVEKSTADRETVVVTAAESLMARIETVEAHFILKGTENSTVSAQAELKAFDAARRVVENATFEPAEVAVTVEFSQKEAQKQVGVRPVITGKISLGFVKSISVNPSLVTISGKPATINALSVVETEKTALDELTGSVEKKLKLKLPEGVTALEGDTVKVIIEIEKIEL